MMFLTNGIYQADYIHHCIYIDVVQIVLNFYQDKRMLRILMKTSKRYVWFISPTGNKPSIENTDLSYNKFG